MRRDLRDGLRLKLAGLRGLEAGESDGDGWRLPRCAAEKVSDVLQGGWSSFVAAVVARRREGLWLATRRRGMGRGCASRAAGEEARAA